MLSYNKVVIALGLGMLLVGCSGDEYEATAPEQAADSAQSAPASVMTPAGDRDNRQESAAADASGVAVKLPAPGKADRSKYVDPDFVDIFHAYHLATNTRADIREWQYRDADRLGMRPVFTALTEKAKGLNASNLGAFDLRDLERAWDEGWDSAIAEHTPPKHIKVVRQAYSAGDIFSRYDFDRQGFRLNLGGGVSAGDEPASLVNWSERAGEYDYGYSIVNAPEFVEVTDEQLARRIEQIRDRMQVNFYGGISEAQEIKRRLVTYRAVLADFQYGEVVGPDGEIVLTF